MVFRKTSAHKAYLGNLWVITFEEMVKIDSIALLWYRVLRTEGIESLSQEVHDNLFTKSQTVFLLVDIFLYSCILLRIKKKQIYPVPASFLFILFFTLIYYENDLSYSYFVNLFGYLEMIKSTLILKVASHYVNVRQIKFKCNSKICNWRKTQVRLQLHENEWAFLKSRIRQH